MKTCLNTNVKEILSLAHAEIALRRGAMEAATAIDGETFIGLINCVNELADTGCLQLKATANTVFAIGCRDNTAICHNDTDAGCVRILKIRPSNSYDTFVAKSYRGVVEFEDGEFSPYEERRKNLAWQNAWRVRYVLEFSTSCPDGHYVEL